jgi:hypothetical protein
MRAAIRTTSNAMRRNLRVAFGRGAAANDLNFKQFAAR